MGVFMWGLPPSGLPTISPSSGEIDSLKSAGPNNGTRHRVLLISPLVGGEDWSAKPMKRSSESFQKTNAGRTEGGNSRRQGRSF